MNRINTPFRRPARLLDLVALLAPGVLATTLTSCTFGGPDPEKTADKTATNIPTVPAELSSLTVPAGFTFTATHPVDVVVQASSSILKEGQVGGIEVARADGKVMYRGPLRSSAPSDVPLTVPLKEKSLSVTLRVTGRSDRHASLAIADKTASYTFQ